VVRDAAGIPQYGVAVIQDITARKEAEARSPESEARLAAVLQQLPVAVGLIDTEGWLVVSNARTCAFVPARIPSRDPERRARWRAFTDDGSLLEPDRWPGPRALRGDVVALGVEFLYTTEDGREIWTRVMTAPFHNAEGQITGAVVVIQDIDALKRAEAALRDLNVTLEQRIAERTLALEQAMAAQQRLEREAQRAEHFALLGRLAAGVAHELRNPLGAVFLHVDVLAEELAQPSPDSPEAVAEALAAIKISLARVDNRMQDYLALVRVHTIQREMQDLVLLR
jgi:signal transduction histidine kinase